MTESQATRDSESGRVLGLPANGVQLALWLAVLGCCAAMAMAMPNVHLFSHATDLGFSSARAAELLSVLFAAAFFSRIAFGMLADRIGSAVSVRRPGHGVGWLDGRCHS